MAKSAHQSPKAPDRQPDQPLRPPRWASWLCFLLPLAVYGLTAARTVQGGDSGEFGVLGMLGGVAHPPGYPIYVGVSRLAGMLFPGPPFLRIALVSALCGAASVAVLQRALWIWTGSAFASVAAALVFGFSRGQWRLAGIPEVFTLNALLVAVMLLMAVRRRPFFLGLAWGLALANHQSAIWCAPLVVWPLVSGAGRPRATLLAIGGTCVGLLAYLLLPIEAVMASPGALVWGDVQSFDGLIAHVLRHEYGTLTLTADVPTAFHTEPLIAFFRMLPGEYGYLPFLAALAGLYICLRDEKPGALAVLGSFVLSGVVFIALLNAGHRADVNLTIHERFHLLPTLLCAPFVASGLAWCERSLPRAPKWIAVSVVLAFMFASNFREANWAGDSFIERYVVTAAQEAAPNAVVMESGDTELSAARWVTHVLKVRPDVHFIDAIMLTKPWYRERMAREIREFPLEESSINRNRWGVLQVLANHGHPAEILSWNRVDRSRLRVEPTGFLDRVVSRDAAPLAPEEARARLERATREFGSQPPPLDAYGASLRAEVADKWMAVSRLFRNAGQVAEARACVERANELYPKGWPRPRAE